MFVADDCRKLQKLDHCLEDEDGERWKRSTRTTDLGILTICRTRKGTIFCVHDPCKPASAPRRDSMVHNYFIVPGPPLNDLRPDEDAFAVGWLVKDYGGSIKHWSERVYAGKCDLVEYLRSDEESSEEAPVFFNGHSAPEKAWLGLRRSHGTDIEHMFYAAVPQCGGPLDEYRMPPK